jgi:hypothetical protein
MGMDIPGDHITLIARSWMQIPDNSITRIMR